MANSYFRFKQFLINQDRCAMKVTTDACLFGAIMAEEVSSRNDLKKALDIGTGTGLLSLMLLQGSPQLKITALEIDPAAAEQALENTAASPWKEQVEIKNVDLLQFPFSQEYDLVFSNPPFYEYDLVSPNEKINLARHNSDLPLQSLFQKVRLLLKDEGEGWFLLPYKRKAEIRDLLSDNDLQILKIILVRSTEKHDYFRIILNIRKSASIIETSLEECTIYQSDGKYTASVETWLAPYYLRL